MYMNIFNEQLKILNEDNLKVIIINIKYFS